jgi:serine/threonine-protein kinase
MTDSGQFHTGKMLGPYELLVPLAQGATAQVWAARTTGSHLEKIVAVKAMSAEVGVDDLDAESMFHDEARLVSRIRHPNVAALLDFGEDGDVMYIVVEWVEGEPLQILMRDAWGSGRSTGPAGRGVPLPLAVRIVKQAAAGLHAAHDLCDDGGKPFGLVHRDVSPQNILVGYDGMVKVIDFGVAKATANMQRTRVGQIKGKFGYMSPEQAAGNPLDRRSDVFGLGIVLYQLVTGKHPFRGDNEYATLVRIRDKAPAEAPSAYLPDLPPSLEEVMLKALAKGRDERIPTMADFGRALERAMPPSARVDRELGTFVSSLLSQRAAKRNNAIRDALDVIRERTGSRPRPINLVTKAVVDDLAPEPPKSAHAQKPEETKTALLQPAQALPPEVEYVDPIELPGVGPAPIRRMLLAAAAIAIVALVVIWAASAMH